MARCSRSRTLARSPRRSTPAPRPRWSASTAANGEMPRSGGLIADANGDLFGTTIHGGANNDGTVFEIQNTGTVAAPVYASAPTTLVSFNGSNGGRPRCGGLIADANGDLFGTTSTAARTAAARCSRSQNTGTVAAPVYASTPTTLVSFNGSNGEDPDARADRRRQRRPVRHDLCGRGERLRHGVRDRRTPARSLRRSTPAPRQRWSASTAPMARTRAGLIADANGDLFGTTMRAAGRTATARCSRSKNTGTVAAPVYASGPTTLVSFNDSNGAYPHGELDRRRQRRPVRHDRWAARTATARCSRSPALALW